MSSFFYDDGQKFKGDFQKSRFDPNRQFKKHFENYMFLNFMMKNGNRVEKHQAVKEMEICERKMKFWKNDQRFDRDQMFRDIHEVKSNWNMDG